MFGSIEEGIRQFGFVVQAVFPTPDEPGVSFAYTVGLQDRGLPELLCFSLPPPVLKVLFDDAIAVLSERFAAGSRFEGKVDHDNWPFPFYLLPVKAHAADDYATAAIARSRGTAPVYQVIWPDKAGQFPWQVNVPSPAQPFLCEAPSQ